MATFQRMSPRRLTGKEESELLEVVEQLEKAEASVAELKQQRDHLITKIVQAGARVTDVASVINLSRSAVYDVVERVLGE